jgi:hypothetical protein
VRAFADVVAGDAEKIRVAWHDSPGFTRLLCEPDGVLHRVGEKLKLKYEKNFLTADAALYSDIVPVVAIEHENDVPGAGHEVKKLGYLDVALGVLITHPKKVEHDPQLLEAYVDDLKAPLPIGNLARDRQLLVIFGTMVGSRVSWRYFKYTDQGFKRIEVDA